MREHADHAVDANVAVGGAHGPDAGHVGGDGEGVGAQVGALHAAMADPGVGERVTDQGGEGEVVEATGGAAEILDGDPGGGEDEVSAATVVDGEGTGGEGVGDDELHVKAGEGGAAGKTREVRLGRDGDATGDVGPGLVGVEGYGRPPLRGGGRRRGGVGEGEQEVAKGGLQGGRPGAVPNEVEVDGGGEDGAHVVAQVDEVRRPFVALGRREQPAGVLSRLAAHPCHLQISFALAAMRKR
ncbi:unnamed protein product [Musa acuminata subsp. burmannicoides]